ncbi:helix-turn-helix domain-containing protein [Pelagibius sp. Alg239-R121]|uniref:helix-turn-helix domain-containing protein n=1 Tax=Pelagibius sp. Alg239-R121 TaxID=2993448 RepID=UPI0024A6DDD1|nr:helix-turn-helix domain-containing protein [Pelagibius sp. Alg239-R121]
MEKIFRRSLEGRHSASHLPAVIDMLLQEPLVSLPMIAKRLGTAHNSATRFMAGLMKTSAIRVIAARAHFKAYEIT